jgi:hypothetical protein
MGLGTALQDPSSSAICSSGDIGVSLIFCRPCDRVCEKYSAARRTQEQVFYRRCLTQGLMFSYFGVVLYGTYGVIFLAGGMLVAKVT